MRTEAPPDLDDEMPDDYDVAPSGPSRGIPHDDMAEEAVLGAMLLSFTACDLAKETGLEAKHFYAPRHGDIYQAISDGLDDGENPDPITVAARLKNLTDHDRRLLIRLQTVVPATTTADAYARRVIHCHRLRRTLGDALAAAAAARSGDLPAAIAHVEHLVVDNPTSGSISHHQLGTFVDSEEPDHDWIIPGLLERTDRILLTGPEGGGKSTLLRQIAVQAAAGIHPFTHNDIRPLRVLLLDLENSERHVRRSLRALRLTAEGHADDNLTIAVHPQGLDLTDPTDVANLTHLIANTAPDLIVGGPVYKLVGGDPTEEMPAKAAAMTLDRLRVAYGFALALETHQPHDNGGKRPERPYGASLWKRWPEFGLHIAETGQLRHWRGARDEREWPAALARGGAWPWSVEIDSKILTYAKIVELVREHGRRLSERELSMMLGAPKTNVHNAIEANKAKFDHLCEQVEG